MVGCEHQRTNVKRCEQAEGRTSASPAAHALGTRGGSPSSAGRRRTRLDAATDSSLSSIFTPGKLAIFLGFILLIVIAGHLVWLAERGKEAFSDDYIPGVIEGMYWAIVTASTVGYGDKAPVKWLGRAVAALVIIISLPLFALFTAAIASSFTVQSLQVSIQGPDDLAPKRVGVVAGTASADHVRRYRPIRVEFKTIDKACQALLKRQVDAVVYDAPNLSFFAQRRGEGKVNVVGKPFMRQRYGIVVPEGDGLRERINLALLTLTEKGDVRRLQEKWFGGDH